MFASYDELINSALTSPIPHIQRTLRRGLARVRILSKNVRGALARAPGGYRCVVNACTHAPLSSRAVRMTVSRARRRLAADLEGILARHAVTLAVVDGGLLAAAVLETLSSGVSAPAARPNEGVLCACLANLSDLPHALAALARLRPPQSPLWTQDRTVVAMMTLSRRAAVCIQVRSSVGIQSNAPASPAVLASGGGSSLVRRVVARRASSVAINQNPATWRSSTARASADTHTPPGPRVEGALGAIACDAGRLEPPPGQRDVLAGSAPELPEVRVGFSREFVQARVEIHIPSPSLTSICVSVRGSL